MVLWTGTTYGSPNIDYRPYTPYDSLISHELELYGLPSNFRFLPLLLTECNERFSNMGFVRCGGPSLWIIDDSRI